MKHWYMDILMQKNNLNPKSPLMHILIMIIITFVNQGLAQTKFSLNTSHLSKVIRRQSIREKKRPSHEETSILYHHKIPQV